MLLSDQRTDLAVLKIDPGAETLPALQFGDSDRIQVGDLVLAIGDPFGVGQTVTAGSFGASGNNGGPPTSVINPNRLRSIPAIPRRAVTMTAAYGITRHRLVISGNIGIGFAIPPQARVSSMAR